MMPIAGQPTVKYWSLVRAKHNMPLVTGSLTTVVADCLISQRFVPSEKSPFMIRLPGTVELVPALLPPDPVEPALALPPEVVPAIDCVPPFAAPAPFRAPP